MKKAVFFDVKGYEKDIILSNIPQGLEPILIEESFHEGFLANYDKIKDAEILSVFVSSYVRSENLKKLPSLKLILTRSTGFNNVDLAYCRENNIDVLNVPNYGDITVAEFSFALLLSLTRKIDIAYNDIREGQIDMTKYVGMDLYGKTVGVVGTGAIGRHFCKIAGGFGMKVLAYDIRENDEMKKLDYLQYVPLDNLVEQSDIISLNVPANEHTYHMINEERLNKMKDGVIIINASRGEVIDTQALYNALLSKKVAAAGLDVLECEEAFSNPQIDCRRVECLEKTILNHKLLTMKNVIVTPHIAFDTKEAIGRILSVTFDNLKKYLLGEVQNKVN